MKILAFFAHPDDETIFSGGTLALLARGGAEIHYLCATRGEGGESGDPPLCAREELGDLRARELACAVEALGGASLDFLDYVDPAVGENGTLSAYTQDFEGLVEDLVHILERMGPEAVITHGSRGEYGHPAHLLSHRAMVGAVKHIPEDPPLVYTVAPYFKDHPRPEHINGEDRADLVVDIAPALDDKIRAAQCHRTQHALFLRHGSRRAGRPVSVPEIVQTVEGLHLVNPEALGKKPDPLVSLLEAHLIAEAG